MTYSLEGFLLLFLSAANLNYLLVYGHQQRSKVGMALLLALLLFYEARTLSTQLGSIL